MKVLLDSNIFNLQKYGGISRYFSQHIKYKSDNIDFTCSGLFTDNIYAIEHKLMHKGNFHFINRYVNKFSDIYQIKKEAYDIFHPTYYMPPIYPQNKPLVVTIHDLIHERFPGKFSNQDAIQKHAIMQAATGIIAISERTKKDILEFYPDIREEKIRVIYHGIEWDYENKRNSLFSESFKYILYTGERSFYKNFDIFVKGISILLTKYDLNLVCTGSSFSEQEKDLFKQLKIENRVFCKYCNEDELKALYENALCFIFPSLYEGFGLPILEAFISECPVVLSNASCFPEIAEDACMYFDPKSIESIQKSVEDVILSESIRNDLIKRGRKRFNYFDLKKSINETEKFYKDIVENY